MNGLLGFIDCTHVQWYQAPHQLAGQYLGYKGYPSLVLGGVCDTNLRFLYHNFQIAGSINDVTIFWHSPITHKFYRGEIQFDNELNQRQRNISFLVRDDAYPKVAFVVLSFSVQTEGH